MRVFCCECGHPVPQRVDVHTGKVVVLRCSAHPAAKRFKQSAAAKWFADMRAAVLAADPARSVWSAPVGNSRYHKSWQVPSLGA